MDSGASKTALIPRALAPVHPDAAIPQLPVIAAPQVDRMRLSGPKITILIESRRGEHSFAWCFGARNRSWGDADRGLRREAAGFRYRDPLRALGTVSS